MAVGWFHSLVRKSQEISWAEFFVLKYFAGTAQGGSALG